MEDHNYHLTKEKIEEPLSMKLRQEEGKQEKTKVYLGDAFARWTSLKREKSFRSDAEVAWFLLDSYERAAMTSSPTKEKPVQVKAPAGSGTNRDNRVLYMRTPNGVAMPPVMSLQPAEPGVLKLVVVVPPAATSGLKQTHIRRDVQDAPTESIVRQNQQVPDHLLQKERIEGPIKEEQEERCIKELHEEHCKKEEQEEHCIKEHKGHCVMEHKEHHIKEEYEEHHIKEEHKERRIKEEHEERRIKEEHEERHIKEEYEEHHIKEEHKERRIKEEHEEHCIKEEHEECRINCEEVEVNLGIKEADTRFPLTSVLVKSENDEKKPQSPQLHQSPPEEKRDLELPTSRPGKRMKTQMEDHGGKKQARNSDLNSFLAPDTDEKDFGFTETDDNSADNDYGDNYWQEPISTSGSDNEDCCSDGSNLQGPLLESGSDTEDSSSDDIRQETSRLQKHIAFHSGKRSSEALGRVKPSTNGQMRFQTMEKQFCCKICRRVLDKSRLLKMQRTPQSGQTVCSFCKKKFRFQT